MSATVVLDNSVSGDINAVSAKIASLGDRGTVYINGAVVLPETLLIASPINIVCPTRNDYFGLG